MELTIIDRQTAQRYFNKGYDIMIGYRHKDGAAFYSRRQFPTETFEEFRAKVKRQLPHTRLAYAFEEEIIPLF